MTGLESIGVAAAITAGMVSFASPCVLPLVPGYISFIAGNSPSSAPSRFKTLALSLCFVLGFSAVFIGLGASTTLLSGFLLRYRTEGEIIGGLIVIVFGLFTAGILNIPALQRDVRFHNLGAGGGPGGAAVLGVAFGFGWTPCIGPILGAILTLSATAESASGGVLLLAAYSLGLGVPFVLSAWFADTIGQRLARFRRAGLILKVAAGGIMVAMGLAMATGKLSEFSYWLLDTFPVFQSIG
ncbi:MAG: cytochrome c biogenesis CcdA family protein [Aestuariivirga sp.]